MTEDILVLAAPSTEGSKGILSREPVPIKLSKELLERNLTQLMGSLKEILAGLRKAGEELRVEEVEVKVEVTAEGGFQLVGAIKAGATGGLTIKIKP